MTGSPVILAAWLVLGLTGFAFVLAAQMRMLISVSLRRALTEKFGDDNGNEYTAAVAALGKTEQPGEHTRWLAETYPVPVSHLRLARRVTYTAPMAILLSIAFLRFVAGAF
jgi:hypothetical protein